MNIGRSKSVLSVLDLSKGKTLTLALEYINKICYTEFAKYSKLSAERSMPHFFLIEGFGSRTEKINKDGRIV